MSTYLLVHGAWHSGQSWERVAHLGPDVTEKGMLYQQFGVRLGNDSEEYRLSYGGETTRLATGYVRHAEAAELAKISVRLGASAPGKFGQLIMTPFQDGSRADIGWALMPQTLPAATTVYVSTEDTEWELQLRQKATADPYVRAEIVYATDEKTYEAGKTYRQDLGIGVFGPALSGERRVFREGDEITSCLPFFADSDGAGAPDRPFTVDTARTTLYREGVEVGTVTAPLDCRYTLFTVPAEKANYRLTSTGTRPSAVAAASTEVSATWTFNSERTAARTALPISIVRFTPRLNPDSTAKAGALAKVPVTIQGAAAGKNLKSLTIEASYDGKTWKKVPVVKSTALVLNPKAGQGISFRATLMDKQGNTLTQTIHNAYLGK